MPSMARFSAGEIVKLILAFVSTFIFASCVGMPITAAEKVSAVAELELNKKCDWAIMAALIPPSMGVASVCSKPFEMIYDDELITLDCRRRCKEKGL